MPGVPDIFDLVQVESDSMGTTHLLFRPSRRARWQRLDMSPYDMMQIGNRARAVAVCAHNGSAATFMGGEQPEGETRDDQEADRDRPDAA